jgi:hypothetical protein
MMPGRVARLRGSDAKLAELAAQRFELFQMSGNLIAVSASGNAAEIPFSQLIQHPRDAVAKLAESPRRQLRLDRRDGEDLILQSAARAEAEDRALSMTSQLFFSLVQHDEGARALLLSLPDVFPWVKFLPGDDVRAFLAELVETLRASASVGNLAALEPVIAAWQATAEIYSDPELLKAAAALAGEDYGRGRRLADP